MARSCTLAYALFVFGCFNPEDGPTGGEVPTEDTSAGPPIPLPGTPEPPTTTAGPSQPLPGDPQPDVPNEPTAQPPGDADFEDADSEDSGSEDASPGHPDTTACMDSERCIPSAPAGWRGPGLRRRAMGAGSSGCGPRYPDLVATGHIGVSAQQANCDCSCTPPENPQCAEVRLIYSEGTECSEPQGANEIAESACEPFFVGQGIASVQAERPEILSGQSCMPVNSQRLAAVNLVGATMICATLGDNTSCGDAGTCLPQAPSDNRTYCIAHDGEVECPPASQFQMRRVLYAEFDDTRGCSACDCGPLQGSCTATIRAFGNPNCNSSSRSFLADGSCASFAENDNYRSASVRYEGAQGSCAVTGGMPQGDVTSRDATTICCAEF